MQGPPPPWKQLLALLSLLLSLLLWLGGLIDSFGRPTVGDLLQVRQLELAALAAPSLPRPLGSALAGADPRRALETELAHQVEHADGPAPAELQLELALLEQQRGETEAAQGRLDTLDPQVLPAQRPLITALRRGTRQPATSLEELQQPWRLGPLSEALLCDQLGEHADGCLDPRLGREAAWRLLGTTLLPALLAAAGLGLLARQGWRLWRGRPGASALAPLLGPPLDPLDVTLLVAGGFVLLGELLTPVLTSPAVTALAAAATADPVQRQGLMVLGLYLALMTGPLLILRLQLPAGLPAEEGLQWRWRPLTVSAAWGLSRMLMVLPPVALVGWLVDQLAGDGGGSNPLLELVLTTRDPLALGCFSLTALVLAPLFEETLFRGALLPVLARRWGAGWGLLVSALSFAVAHLSLAELPALLVLGLGLGWLRLRSGRLGCCVLMHGLWNSLTFANLLLLAG